MGNFQLAGLNIFVLNGKSVTSQSSFVSSVFIGRESPELLSRWGKSDFDERLVSASKFSCQFSCRYSATVFFKMPKPSISTSS
jgi:hypothetical protein